MIDVNNDHEKELVSIVGSTFAGLPRGVFVHDVTTGHKLGSLILGAPILNPVYIEDLDQDGKTEMIFASGISNHGAEAGGLNDGEGYLLIIELAGNPVLEWWKPVDVPNTRFRAYTGRFTDNRGYELVTVTIQSRSTKSHNSQLRSYDLGRPFANQTPSVVTIPGILILSTAGDLDGDGLQEIYTLSNQGEIVRHERF